MKRSLFLPPLFSALLFSVPQALEIMAQPPASYVPVVYELLLLVFSYAAALAVNAVLVLPLAWLLLRLCQTGIVGGLVFSLLLALTGDIVGYAFEIFDYQPSIFHPAYLYTLFLPLLVLALAGFFLLRMALRNRPVPAAQAPVATDTGDAQP